MGEGLGSHPSFRHEEQYIRAACEAFAENEYPVTGNEAHDRGPRLRHIEIATTAILKEVFDE